MLNFPRYLIFPDKIYILTILHQSDVERANERNLIDYRIELKNPADGSDSFTLLLGVTRGFAVGYRNTIPLEWLLTRFLCDHIRANTIRLLDGKNGEVLTYKTHKKYLGVATSQEAIHETLFKIFHSWMVTFPREPLSWRDLFVSSISITEEALKKGIDSLEEYLDIKKGTISLRLSGESLQGVR
jgi:hypothetical protein